MVMNGDEWKWIWIRMLSRRHVGVDLLLRGKLLDSCRFPPGYSRTMLAPLTPMSNGPSPSLPRQLAKS